MKIKLSFTLVILSLCNFTCTANDESPKKPKDFITSISSIRKVVSTQIGNEPALFISGLTGEVGCYTTSGKELWRTSTPNNNALVFDIEAEDINGDNQDEYIAVSADGYVHCWDSTGKTLWNFRPEVKVRLSQVEVIKTDEGAFVFVGGNNNRLYKLDNKGALVSANEIKGVMARMEAGNFVDKNTNSLFVMTYTHDKTGYSYGAFLDPISGEELKEFKTTKLPKDYKSLMVTDVKVSDVNKDGRDDVLIFGTTRQFFPAFYAIDGDGNNFVKFTPTTKEEKQGAKYIYAHAIGESLTPIKDEIIMRHGRIVFKVDTKGKLIERTSTKEKKERFAVNSIVLEKESKTLFVAGEVDGGNAVYALDINSNEGWQRNPPSIGRVPEVRKNIKELYKQVMSFELPSYQTKEKDPWVMVYRSKLDPKIKDLKGANLTIIPRMESWRQKYDRSEIIAAVGEEYGSKRDRRGDYVNEEAYFLDRARTFEKNKEPFVIWAGHGSDPFYTDINTLEKILKVAPTTCHGFVFAEMAKTEDPRSHYYVNTIMPRLAKACREHGFAKLYYRYKQTFWATDVQLEPWRTLFLSKKYKDIVVPCTEDTNSYTQDLNLAGRVGMMMGGYVDNFGMRIVGDNVTGWRPFAPGGQRLPSCFVRSGVMRAIYGAKHGVISGNFDLEDDLELNLLFALMGSGVLPQANQDNIESIGSWHVIDGLNEKFTEKEHSGHDVDNYGKEDEEAVLSVTQVHWAGSSVPEYDFSKALGVDYRWLNFVPELPNGMIPIAPGESEVSLKENNTPYIKSDVSYGIVNGERLEPKEFGAILMETAKKGADNLLINVKGAAWSAIRLDESHIRVILLDQGYLDPQERNAVITFNKKQPTSAKDILSGKPLKVEENQVKLTVPAGAMKFIDITY
ncbi:hypothetical protein Q4Q39_02170 [Flavivirga amylovorans]|uniref:PQQ-binding-like beta-propeller repeat protein n=1 Tax=Flavivirga amylovorans TaxID=870486 RepID=A0ABT8WXJ3_9FLAO|nr:hypothetical protein [Flavivirga amylovorans]MDO5986198.1 hypothetical protein [Flavivirga amylovorans]